MRGKKKADRHRVLSRHIARLDHEIIKLQELDRRYFWVRLAVLLVGVLGFFLAYQSHQSRNLIFAGLVFLVAFSLVVYFNRKVKTSLIRFNLSRQYFLSQIARMDLAWDRIPPAPNFPSGDKHPFASDLNISGNQSLHQLLSTAVSRGGSTRLQDWLLEQDPSNSQVYQRREIVEEMKSLSGFRSRLALSSSLVTVEEDQAWDGEELISWLAKQIASGSLKPILIILAILAAANILFFALFSLGLVPAFWMITLGIYAAVYLFAYRNMKDIFGQAQHLSTTLDRFRAVLVFIEKYSFRTGSHLFQLCETFWADGQRPSSYLRRISLIASASSIGANPVVWLLINVFVPWDVFFAYQLQRYKSKMQVVLPAWLDTWYELEALNSLANFSFLNPDYTFPIVDNQLTTQKPLIKTFGVGHPLIPDEVKVCNDFSIDELGEVVIITGSNMSGKSTFLRTIGINLCLAFAGGPVNAESFSTNMFRLFTVIQVKDSLVDGISYFYAEVKRLKALLDALEMADDLPVFFLIDEIFRGTNNREREIGGRAFVRKLVGEHGVGLISTHDLELVIFADELPGVTNYHFQEEIVQDRMTFDYLLRPGPSRTTNALQIMNLEGLPVEISTEPD